MSREATLPHEIIPGLYESGTLPEFKADSQGWKKVAHRNADYFGRLVAGEHILRKCAYDGPWVTSNMDLVYSQIVLGSGKKSATRYLFSHGSMLEDLARDFEPDEEAQAAITVLGMKLRSRAEARQQSVRERMAEAIVAEREHLNVLVSATRVYEMKRHQGTFGKLWGITLDTSNTMIPVVVGKDYEPAVAYPKEYSWLYVGTLD